MDARKLVNSNEQYLNEHVLIKILVLLPPKSIFRFICVSKRWKDIISDPFFLQSYSRRRRSCSDGGRLLAFFQQPTTPFPFGSNGRRVLPICKKAAYCIKSIPQSIGCFMNSSNGLILCCSDTTKYHVVNPVTGRWVSLPPPQPNDKCSYTRAGLMCEENTSELKASYIVILVVCNGLHKSTNTMQIQKYSSKTGKWALSTLVATGKFKFRCGSVGAPMVANGVFHWFVYGWSIVVYDPNHDDQNHAQLIQLPPSLCSAGCRFARSSDDMLWCALTGHVRMKFWMLPKGVNGSYMRATTIPKEEWILMYNITYENIIHGARFRAFISWDPLVVLLKHLESFFLYNIESKTMVERVMYQGTLEPRQLFCWRPFMESSFLSSYAAL